MLRINSRNARKDIDKLIGANLRFRRNAAGMSQLEFGEAIGVTFQQVQKYENGSNRIAASTLYAASKILNVPLLTFFRGLDEQQPQQIGDAFLSKDNVEFLALYDSLPHAMKRDIKSIVKRMSVPAAAS